MTVKRSVAAQQKRMLDHFQALRLQFRWSYARLAAESDLDPATVHSALTGKTNPSFITIEAIANAFGLHQELT